MEPMRTRSLTTLHILQLYEILPRGKGYLEGARRVVVCPRHSLANTQNVSGNSRDLTQSICSTAGCSEDEQRQDVFFSRIYAAKVMLTWLAYTMAWCDVGAWWMLTLRSMHGSEHKSGLCSETLEFRRRQFVTSST